MLFTPELPYWEARCKSRQNRRLTVRLPQQMKLKPQNGSLLNSESMSDINRIPPVTLIMEWPNWEAATVSKTHNNERGTCIEPYEHLLREPNPPMTGSGASRCCCLLARLGCSVLVTAPVSPEVLPLYNLPSPPQDPGEESAQKKKGRLSYMPSTAGGCPKLCVN